MCVCARGARIHLIIRGQTRAHTKRAHVLARSGSRVYACPSLSDSRARERALSHLPTAYGMLECVHVCVCVCVCVCARARARACVRACVRACEAASLMQTPFHLTITSGLYDVEWIRVCGILHPCRLGTGADETV